MKVFVENLASVGAASEERLRREVVRALRTLRTMDCEAAQALLDERRATYNDAVSCGRVRAPLVFDAEYDQVAALEPLAGGSVSVLVAAAQQLVVGITAVEVTAGRGLDAMAPHLSAQRSAEAPTRLVITLRGWNLEAPDEISAGRIILALMEDAFRASEERPDRVRQEQFADFIDGSARWGDSATPSLVEAWQRAGLVRGDLLAPLPLPRPPLSLRLLRSLRRAVGGARELASGIKEEVGLQIGATGTALFYQMLEGWSLTRQAGAEVALLRKQAAERTLSIKELRYRFGEVDELIRAARLDRRTLAEDRPFLIEFDLQLGEALRLAAVAYRRPELAGDAVRHLEGALQRYGQGAAATLTLQARRHILLADAYGSRYSLEPSGTRRSDDLRRAAEELAEAKPPLAMLTRGDERTQHLEQRWLWRVITTAQSAYEEWIRQGRGDGQAVQTFRALLHEVGQVDAAGAERLPLHPETPAGISQRDFYRAWRQIVWSRYLATELHASDAEAGQWLQQAVELGLHTISVGLAMEDPSPEDYSWLALVYRMAADEDRVHEVFQQGLAQLPSEELRLLLRVFVPSTARRPEDAGAPRLAVRRLLGLPAAHAFPTLAAREAYEAAELAVAAGSLEQARVSLRQALAIRPEPNGAEGFQLRAVLAEVEVLDGQFGEAIESLEALVGGRARMPAPLRAMALVLLAQAYLTRAEYADDATDAQRTLKVLWQATRSLAGERPTRAVATLPTVRPALPGVRYVIAVAANKGGVGKSTVAVNLALALQAAGARVGLLDADLTGPSVPIMLGIEAGSQAATGLGIVERYGLQVLSIGTVLPEGSAVIWRGPMMGKAVGQMIGEQAWGHPGADGRLEPLDYLVVDLPPGTSDVSISMSQAVPIAGVVMVTTPSGVAVEDVKKAFAMFKRLAIPVLGVVENMKYFACPDCGAQHEIFGPGAGETLAREEGVDYLGSVPVDQQASDIDQTGVPIVMRDPVSPTSQTFAAVARDLIGRTATGAAANVPAARRRDASHAPLRREIAHGLARASAALGDLDGALGQMERLLRLGRADAELAAEIAEVWLAQGWAAQRVNEREADDLNRVLTGTDVREADARQQLAATRALARIALQRHVLSGDRGSTKWIQEAERYLSEARRLGEEVHQAQDDLEREFDRRYIQEAVTQVWPRTPGDSRDGLFERLLLLLPQTRQGNALRLRLRGVVEAEPIQRGTARDQLLEWLRLERRDTERLTRLIVSVWRGRPVDVDDFVSPVGDMQVRTAPAVSSAVAGRVLSEAEQTALTSMLDDASVSAVWDQVVADPWLPRDAKAAVRAQIILARMLIGSLSVSEASQALFELKGGGAYSAELIVRRLAEARQGRNHTPPSGVAGTLSESATKVAKDASELGQGQ